MEFGEETAPQECLVTRLDPTSAHDAPTTKGFKQHEQAGEKQDDPQPGNMGHRKHPTAQHQQSHDCAKDSSTRLKIPGKEL